LSKKKAKEKAITMSKQQVLNEKMKIETRRMENAKRLSNERTEKRERIEKKRKEMLLSIHNILFEMNNVRIHNKNNNDNNNLYNITIKRKLKQEKNDNDNKGNEGNVDSLSNDKEAKIVFTVMDILTGKISLLILDESYCCHIVEISTRRRMSLHMEHGSGTPEKKFQKMTSESEAVEAVEAVEESMGYEAHRDVLNHNGCKVLARLLTFDVDVSGKQIVVLKTKTKKRKKKKIEKKKESKTKILTNIMTETKIETKIETEIESKIESKNETEIATKSEIESEAKTMNLTNTVIETEITTEITSESKIESEAKTKSLTNTVIETESEAGKPKIESNVEKTPFETDQTTNLKEEEKQKDVTKTLIVPSVTSSPSISRSLSHKAGITATKELIQLHQNGNISEMQCEHVEASHDISHEAATTIQSRLRGNSIRQVPIEEIAAENFADQMLNEMLNELVSNSDEENSVGSTEGSGSTKVDEALEEDLPVILSFGGTKHEDYALACIEYASRKLEN